MSSISEQELEREVRTLKHLRRRSVTSAGPGELPVDPDLPPPDAFQHGSEIKPYSSNDDVTLSLDGDSGLFWVPAHLHPELAPGEFRNFLKSHTVDPDSDPANEGSEAAMARSPSWLARSRSMSGGLGRKKSMLSKQYQPRAGDNVEAEHSPVRRGSIAQRGGADTGPTLRDLQKLEELVDDPEFVQNPDKMREVLRRSLSQRHQPGMNETMEGDGEESTLPPMPRPGSIIRRTARTKIRKTLNDGSRRYSSGRRQRLSSPSQQAHGDSSSMEDGDRRSDERRSDETSEEASRESEALHQPTRVPAVAPPMSDESADEAMIFDAYARHSQAYDGSRSPSPEERPLQTTQPPRERPTLSPIITPTSKTSGAWKEDSDITPTQDPGVSAALHAMSLLDPSGGGGGDIFQATADSYADNYADAYANEDAYRAYLEEEEEPPQPPTPPTKVGPSQQQHQQLQRQQQLPAQPDQRQQLPQGGMAAPMQHVPPGMSTSAHERPGLVPPALQIERPTLARTDSNSSTVTSVSTASNAAPSQIREKEKSKKGLFGKKHSKDKDKDKEKHKKEKDGLFGSLFGSKKKQEEASSVANFSTAGPAAAAALLGASKSAKTSLQPSGASSPTSPGFSNFARYPIHVERAVYRLSHIKLANARRPLIEQVLISNLMFWYLGVIGRAAGPAEDSKPGTVNGLDKDRDESQRTPPPKGTPAKSPDSGQFEDKSGHPRHQQIVQQREQREQDTSPSPSPTRKTGLVKPERSRAANNSEAAYRAPQYGMQNAQMEQEMRPGGLKQQPQHPQQQQHSIHSSPQRQHSPPPSQPQQQQQHYQQGPTPGPRASSSPAPVPAPRTSSINSHPQRTRSPPSPAHQTQQPRQEYPPGVAPPRPQQFAPGGNRPVQPAGEGRRPVATVQTVRPPPPQAPNGSMRGDRPIYAPHGSPSSQQRSSPTPAQQRGGQPGQVFQYPHQYARPGHHGPQPGQIFTAQPGQIFHHPGYGGQQGQQQQQQRPPPGAAGSQSWERLPQQQQLAQTPPRRTSSNSQADPYGRQQGYPREGGQTSPTHGGFYSQQRPPAQFQYPAGQHGQARPQPVPSGQYPHHR